MYIAKLRELLSASNSAMLGLKKALLKTNHLFLAYTLAAIVPR